MRQVAADQGSDIRWRWSIDPKQRPQQLLDLMRHLFAHHYAQVMGQAVPPEHPLDSSPYAHTLSPDACVLPPVVLLLAKALLEKTLGLTEQHPLIQMLYLFLERLNANAKGKGGTSFRQADFPELAFVLSRLLSQHGESALEILYGFG